jgi:hypothetical protein
VCVWVWGRGPISHRGGRSVRHRACVCVCVCMGHGIGRSTRGAKLPYHWVPGEWFLRFWRDYDAGRSSRGAKLLYYWVPGEWLLRFWTRSSYGAEHSGCPSIILLGASRVVYEDVPQLILKRNECGRKSHTSMGGTGNGFRRDPRQLWIMTRQSRLQILQNIWCMTSDFLEIF